MKSQIEKFTSFIFIVLLAALLSFSISIASAIEEEDIQLPEPAGSCSSDPCSPASPCPSKDEKCYSSNGAFYCCAMPPFPGAEAVGN